MGKGSFVPSSDFIAKNQLAREVFQSVSPVTIPALTTIKGSCLTYMENLTPVLFVDTINIIKSAAKILTSKSPFVSVLL